MAELIWEGKYDKDGKKHAPVKIALPFQTIETVNESTQERQRSLLSSSSDSEWRNRLIWGDKKFVLPSLIPEFGGKVDLIYIDPPFDTGADFSFNTTIPETEDMFTKEPSVLEQKAYRDTWGSGLDSYLAWFHDTVALLYELLAPTGTLYVHLDWHVGHYAKAVLDEVLGSENFVNDITWWYYNKFAPESRCFPRASDRIMAYAKNFGSHIFNKQEELRDKPVKQLKRKFIGGKAINVRDEAGVVQYQEKNTKRVDDVWRISMLQPADKIENVRYPTQKPQPLLERIVNASSNPDDLVLDCFAGSGTTAVASEKLDRRWIACDLGRFAIHTTRKRLLGMANVRPFVVQNLGKYERQAWQSAEFPADEHELRERQRQETEYRKFILDLYSATPISGKTWLHGVKGQRMIHVGAVDAPVTQSDFKAIAQELWKSVGKGAGAPEAAKVDILGWEFAFEINETAKQMAAAARVDAKFKKIPREVLEKKAVDQGDIKFFELGALTLNTSKKGKEVTVSIEDFIIPTDDIPEEVRGAIQNWSQLVDYWAVDWDYKNDTFHNQWQSYRTRKDPKIDLKARHEYAERGTYLVVVKVIDILGNDTTKSVEVTIK